jgi:hypothetical protein
MSWEDQGRQYHEWFGHGTAPPKLKTPVEKAPAPAPDSLPARLTAVIHGALGALKRSARAQAESQLRAGLLPRLTEAMTAWAQGSSLDAQSFAYHFFHRDAADQVVTSLRDAAVGAATATRQDELAAASKRLADAMTNEGLDTWPRFVAQALERARNPATLAAVTKSLRPVLLVSAAVGKPTSGSVGSGTKLATAIENDPLKDQPSEGGGAIVGHGGGAMPDIGPPAPGGDSGPPSAAEPLPVPAAPAEAPAAKPAAPPAAKPAVTVKGGNPAPRARVTSNRRVHILDGDKTGGGHRSGTGKPNKSEFPTSWSDDKIIAEIESVANDPASKRSSPDKEGRIEIEGSRDGVDILVVLSKDKRTIITAYPTNLPTNPPRGK